MKAYLIASGSVFGLLVLAHLARLVAEGWQAARDPFFVASTVLAAGLGLWAWRLLTKSAR